MNWQNQWRSVSLSNRPIIRYLETLKVESLTLLDLGCGKGVLSELAKKKGFIVTSIDLGNTPYKYNLKTDSKTLKGYWDYIIAAGFPPSQLPKNVECNFYIYTTQREDFVEHYPGDLYYDDDIFIKTNIKDFFL